MQVQGQDTVRVWRSEGNLRCGPPAPSTLTLRKGILLARLVACELARLWLSLSQVHLTANWRSRLAHHVPAPCISCSIPGVMPLTELFSHLSLCILRQKLPTLFLET